MIKNISSFIKLKPVLAVGFLFSASSLVFGTWVASIPGIKYRLGFNNATLGLSLLLSPLGALTGVLLSTRLFSKIPVGKWMIAGYISLCIIMILQINSLNRVMFWTCLYLFGMNGFLNGVSVNTTVGYLEKHYNRRLMSTCHGMYSLGGGVSAAFATVFFALNLSPRWQILFVAAIIGTVVFLNGRYLLSHNRIIHSGSGLKFPSLSILSISFGGDLKFCMSPKNLFFQATIAAVSISKINNDKAADRFTFSEIKPITDGPVRKPINPPVVTIANPSTVLTPGIEPDALNSTGTMQQHPNPIKTYPPMATEIAGASTTIKNPIAASIAPATTTRLLPNFVMILSPLSLPIVIAAEKPAYPRPMISLDPCKDSLK